MSNVGRDAKLCVIPTQVGMGEIHYNLNFLRAKRICYLAKFVLALSAIVKVYEYDFRS